MLHVTLAQTVNVNRVCNIHDARPRRLALRIYWGKLLANGAIGTVHGYFLYLASFLSRLSVPLVNVDPRTLILSGLASGSPAEHVLDLVFGVVSTVPALSGSSSSSCRQS